MKLEHVVLLERALVDKHLNALTRRVLATLVLLLDSLFASAQASLFAFGNQFFDLFCLFAHKNIIVKFDAISKLLQRYEKFD